MPYQVELHLGQEPAQAEQLAMLLYPKERRLFWVQDQAEWILFPEELLLQPWELHLL